MRRGIAFAGAAVAIAAALSACGGPGYGPYTTKYVNITKGVKAGLDQLAKDPLSTVADYNSVVQGAIYELKLETWPTNAQADITTEESDLQTISNDIVTDSPIEGAIAKLGTDARIVTADLSSQ